MGCCGSRDVIAVAPDVLLPDPREDETIQVTIAQTEALSRDYTAYRGNSQLLQDSWFFLNKSGSKWGGQVCIELENFLRINPDPKLKDKGQVLWRADFNDSPRFQQQMRNPGQQLYQMAFRGWGDYSCNWGNDDYYLGRRAGGWGRHYPVTLVINWTMQSEAVLSTTMRSGWGVPIELSVYACGTAVARYWEEDVPIYEQRPCGPPDENGYQPTESVQVGTRREWRHDTDEYVDYTQFCVCNAATKEPMMANGAPAYFTVNGDATDYLNNFSTQFFSVQQNGGWASITPKIVNTMPGVDPTFAVLLAHVCTKEFTTSEIKGGFHPHFPENPHHAAYGLF